MKEVFCTGAFSMYLFWKIRKKSLHFESYYKRQRRIISITSYVVMKGGEMERLKAYRNIIQKLQWNTAIEDILIRKDFVDRKRVLLLQDIINAMEERIPDLEEIRNKTFEYGCMIEKDDLLARHIFIVLQIYLRERTEPAGIYVMEMTEPVGVGRTGKRRFV